MQQNTENTLGFKYHIVLSFNQLPMLSIVTQEHLTVNTNTTLYSHVTNKYCIFTITPLQFKKWLKPSINNIRYPFHRAL